MKSILLGLPMLMTLLTAPVQKAHSYILIATSDGETEVTGTGVFLTVFFLIAVPPLGIFILLDESGNQIEGFTDEIEKSYPQLLANNPDAKMYLENLIQAKATEQYEQGISPIKVSISQSELKESFQNSDVDFNSQEFQNLAQNLR